MIFERDQEPKESMGLGISGEVEKWFDENNSAHANHRAKVNGNRVTVHITGSLVLKQFDIDMIDAVKDTFKVEIGEVSGTFIILNLLGSQQIYKKIKSFYTRVLEDCLEKTIEEQSAYLFGDNKRKLKAGVIEESVEYIRSLPDRITNELLIDLATQIESGILEYAYSAKDNYSVKMEQYARSLKSMLN